MYIESLDRLSDLPHVSTVLPAHGQPFHDLAARAEEIKRHHDERLDRLLEICDTVGWANVIHLSHELFAPRSWGSMAEAETFAHLERLRATARCDAAKRLASCCTTFDAPFRAGEALIWPRYRAAYGASLRWQH